MEFFVQLFVSFLMLGCMYTLVAVGFTMYVGVINLANFSHGDTCVVGAFVLMPLFTLFADLGWVKAGGAPVVVALIAATILLTGAWGVVLFRVVVYPLLRSPRLIVLLATVAAGQAIRETIRVIYPEGSNPQVFPRLLPQGGLHLGTAMVRWESLIILAATLATISLLNLFITRTKMGLAMRAVSQDHDVAQMMGVPLDRTVMTVFFVGSMLAGLAGVMNGAYYQITKFDIGNNLGIKGFSAAVIGGLGNIYGAIVGGLLLSLVEVFSAALVPGGSQFQDVFSFLVVIVFLVFKPSGILGEKVHEKV